MARGSLVVSLNAEISPNCANGQGDPGVLGQALGLDLTFIQLLHSRVKTALYIDFFVKGGKPLVL